MSRMQSATPVSLIARLEFAESMRSRWFHFYALVVIGLMVLLILTGVSESRVLGFTGLSRLLVTYIQIAMAILPLFIVVTTARSMVGDREAGNLEYMLSFPAPLSGWYWGRFAARFVLIVLPVLAALAMAAVYGLVTGHAIPWKHILLYTGLVAALSICFLGLGFFISAVSRSTEVALGVSLIIWLTLVALLDLLLLSVLIKARFVPEFVIGIALGQPAAVFPHRLDDPV